MSPVAVFAVLFGLMAIGRVLVARKVVAADAAQVLNQLALYVCLPCAVLLHVPALRWEPALLGLIVVPWLLTAASVALILLSCRLFGWTRATQICLLLVVPLGNTSFLGYPLCSALLGADALKYAVVYDQFGSFLLLSTYGITALALGQGQQRPTARSVALRVATFPPFLLLLLALTVVPAELPSDVRAGLSMVAGSLLPMVALALGMQLRFRLEPSERAPLLLALALKLVLLPLLALGLAQLLTLGAPLRQIAVLESAMPTMITAGALLSMAGLEPRLAAAVVGYGTVLAPVTLYAWRSLLG